MEVSSFVYTSIKSTKDLTLSEAPLLLQCWIQLENNPLKYPERAKGKKCGSGANA